MAIVDVGYIYSSLPADSQPKLVDLVCGLAAMHLALSLHSSNEPGELSQWLAMMTKRINTILIIIIIFIFFYFCFYKKIKENKILIPQVV